MAYIERNISRGFGQPVIADTRISVFSVLNNALWSDNVTIFLSEVGLSFEQLKSAIEYCKGRECKMMSSVNDKYCNGCILRSIGEGWHSGKNDFIENNSISVSKDGETFSLGSIEDLDNDEFGVFGWEIAEKLDKKLNM